MIKMVRVIHKKNWNGLDVARQPARQEMVEPPSKMQLNRFFDPFQIKVLMQIKEGPMTIKQLMRILKHRYGIISTAIQQIKQICIRENLPIAFEKRKMDSVGTLLYIPNSKFFSLFGQSNGRKQDTQIASPEHRIDKRSAFRILKFYEQVIIEAVNNGPLSLVLITGLLTRFAVYGAITESNLTDGEEIAGTAKKRVEEINQQWNLYILTCGNVDKAGLGLRMEFEGESKLGSNKGKTSKYIQTKVILRKVCNMSDEGIEQVFAFEAEYDKFFRSHEITGRPLPASPFS